MRNSVVYDHIVKIRLNIKHLCSALWRDTFWATAQKQFKLLIWNHYEHIFLHQLNSGLIISPFNINNTNMYAIKNIPIG